MAEDNLKDCPHCFKKIQNVAIKFIKFIWYDCLKHPLILLAISGYAIWLLQQGYLKKEKIWEKKYEIFKTVSSLPASYYHEAWNEYYAFKKYKRSSGEYKRNIQCIVDEAKAIQIQLPLFFKDEKIKEDWGKILDVFWETENFISKNMISEQELNEKFSLIDQDIDDILERMYKGLN